MARAGTRHDPSADPAADRLALTSPFRQAGSSVCWAMRLLRANQRRATNRSVQAPGRVAMPCLAVRHGRR